MTPNKKDQICALLKGIESGDPESVLVVNEKQYIQHNPQTHEGSEGLAALFKRLSETKPHVNIVRVFEDGDFVFAHTEYDFASRNIGFEIFRFDNHQAVEHWDNIQTRKGPNLAGHSMVDGATVVEDRELTEPNRALIKSFIQTALIAGKPNLIDTYVNQQAFIDHNPYANTQCNLPGILLNQENTQRTVRYLKAHKILAEGNFVLSVCEGSVDTVPYSFFDLYRIQNEKIVEHWDTVEAIPPRSEWKNTNGKF